MRVQKIRVLVLLMASSLFWASCDHAGKESQESKETDKEETAKGESVEKGTAADTAKAVTKADVVVALDKMPAGTKEFVEKNFPGYTMSKAIEDPLCGGAPAIDLAITKAGSPNLSLIFKPDGTFVQKEEDVPYASAPESIKSVLKMKYADYTTGDQIERLTLADKTIEYLVDVTKFKKSKEVIFAADGSVVCGN